jgi:serine/threonine protein kinase
MDTHHVAMRCVYNPGDNFEGMYQVRKSLGEGSFGAVYQVTDGHGMSYALKLLRLWDVSPDIRKDLCDRFRREYETGRIDCRQLVHALSYGEVKGNPYILMEFCPGGDLTPVLGHAGQRTVPICRDILLGLKAIHQHDKVHRDLKPENVLFKQDGTAALTDFGIVGDRLQRMTQVGLITRKPKQIFGTYAYMPPEQAELVGGGATIKNTTDIFSFGVLAYQLITNQLPFGRLETHNDVSEYLKRGKSGQWNRNALHFVSDSQSWVNLIEGCLKANYRERLQSVDDVLRLLPQSSSQTSNQSQNGFWQTGMQYAQTSYAVQSSASVSYRQYRLRITNGRAQGHTYELDTLTRLRGQVLEIGRDPDCAIYVPNPEEYVSRWHCTLQLSPNRQQWHIRDGRWNNTEQRWMPSRNGTFVNSQRIGPKGYYLAAGDTVCLGDVTLVFEYY